MNKEIKPLQSNGDVPFVKRMLLMLTTIIVSMFCLAIFVPGPLQKNAFMGAEYCGSCHQEQYKTWAMSAHKHATAVLPKDLAGNRACLSCHATAVFEENEPYLPGVQCEACHGPGQYYASLHIKKDAVLSKLLFMQRPTVESCRHCHSDTANLWSPHQAMQKIDHWSDAKKMPFHGAGVQLNGH